MLPDCTQSYTYVCILHIYCICPIRKSSSWVLGFSLHFCLSSHSHFDNNSVVINYRVTFFVSLPFICHVICDNDFSSGLFNAHKATHTERERASGMETLTRTLLWFEVFVGHFPLSLYVYFSFPPQRCGISVHFSHILRCAVSTCVCVCVSVRNENSLRLWLCLCFALLSFISFHFISLQFIFHVVAIRVVARLCFKAFRNPFRNYVSLFNIMLCIPLALALSVSVSLATLSIFSNNELRMWLSHWAESLPGAWCRWGQVWH